MLSQSDVYRDYVAELGNAIERLPWDTIRRVEESLLLAWERRKQIFIVGNGGSAATASHMACDLGKNTITPGLPRVRAISLNDNMAHFTALANDEGYENVFAEQVRNYADEGDVLVAISTSGNSPNVIEAVKAAQELGAFTIGWTGYQGGRLATLVDLSLVVDSNSVEQIEDIHLILEHMFTVALRAAIREFAVEGTVLQPVPVPVAYARNGNHNGMSSKL